MEGGGHKLKHFLSKSLAVFVVSLLLFSSFASIGLTANASLFFSPASGSYQIGDVFTVGVYAGSNEQSMNAVSAVVSFSADKLEVVSLNKGGTIMSLWVQEPSHNNVGGTINFEGIVLNPGYTGASGNIISVVFKAKQSGTADLRFTSGSILANDGQGTALATSFGQGSYQIGTSDKPEPESVPVSEPEPKTEPTLEPDPVVRPEPEPTSERPDYDDDSSAPIVMSASHPDPDKWYADSTIELAWSLPRFVTGVSRLLNEKPSSNPGPSSDGLMDQERYVNVDDGLWYFHVKLESNQGWSVIAHLPIRIDTAKPTGLLVEEIEREDSTISEVDFLISAKDRLSGIDRYEIMIDGKQPAINWEGGDIFTTETLSPGNHLIYVKAFDKAGNYITDTQEFAVDEVPIPIIGECPKDANLNEVIIVRGLSKVGLQVSLWLQDEDGGSKNYIVEADDQGRFVAILDDKLAAGSYTLWAEAINEFGAKSQPSVSQEVVIRYGSLWDIGSWPRGMSILLLSLVILDIILSMLLGFSLKRLYNFKHIASKELHLIKKVLHSFHKELPGIKKASAKRKYAPRKKSTTTTTRKYTPRKKTTTTRKYTPRATASKKRATTAKKTKA